mmetsp:Transcript_11186/g.17296  ORF Transcript_11186/g.17296 Transcript_11186/m.17296 type:complete len:175 (-) Transcript_11186:80-604(-)|eukprot:CAMPEP_0178920322 /NCGR_PEP_ID=MMETSP0786-20121207/14942_1 /TAXON_ID=186022 /ORGANISM="Thalassionema frauenfeldii, Strain CCMP 1798" /LENGTH=174 /DNA_ID=CAMNT_0020594379 /DNA_START=88 /DNA_END=612 /DNA_ORIENTATION=-
MAKTGAKAKKKTAKRASGKKKNAPPQVEKAIKVEDDYFEVEKVVDKRKRGKQVEYKIRWKGCTEADDTWEPARNLCDTAYVEAMKFEKPTAESSAAKKAEKSTEDNGKKSDDKAAVNGEIKADNQGKSDEKSELKSEDQPKKEDVVAAGVGGVKKDQNEKEKIAGGQAADASKP